MRYEVPHLVYGAHNIGDRYAWAARRFDFLGKTILPQKVRVSPLRMEYDLEAGFWKMNVGDASVVVDFFQPTTQPTKTYVLYDFCVVWQSPRSCKLL